MKVVIMGLAAAVLIARPATAQICTKGDCGNWNWDFFGIPALDDTQKGKIDQLRMDYIKDVLLLDHEVHKAEVAVKVALATSPIDEAKVKEALARKSKAMTDREQRTLDFVIAVKHLLKPQQLRWLDEQLLTAPEDIAFVIGDLIFGTFRSRFTPQDRCPPCHQPPGGPGPFGPGPQGPGMEGPPPGAPCDKAPGPDKVEPPGKKK